MLPITILSKIEFFSNISSASLDKLLLFTQQRSYKKNAIVSTGDDAVKSFLYVVVGWLKVSNISVNGKEIIIDLLGAKQHWGELRILQKAKYRLSAYSVQALSDVTVISLSTKTLTQLIQTDPVLSMNFLRLNLERQQHYLMTIEHLSIQNTVQRLACFILRACSEITGNSITLQLPCDKVILATYLGMRAETFSRSLHKLTEQCHIKIQGHQLYIEDIRMLATYVCQHCSKCLLC